MSIYYRPFVCFHRPRPAEAEDVAGGPGWYARALRLERGRPPEHVTVQDLPETVRLRIRAPRPAMAGVLFDQPRIMGILNVTPDSFSDGGHYASATHAVKQAQDMVADGADIIDVGGESTRPGAQTVPAEAEIARVEPVIRALAHELGPPISIDTRKCTVADAAVSAGARLVNDVSGFTFDPLLARYCADKALPVCVMHAQGEPETMHLDPRYDNVLLEVYDFLAARITELEAQGIPRARILVDPGIGFGKTLEHNLTLLSNVSLFHGLGCALLVGGSRKGFIGRISGATKAAARMPGSVACALAVVAQGVQMVRVHDVSETRQALSVWQAISKGEHS